MIKIKWLGSLGALKGFSPWGILVAGVIVGTVGLPVLRKGMRSLAVQAVKGVIVVGEGARDLSQKINREWTELVDEAKSVTEDKKENYREKIHRLELESVKKGMIIAGRAKEKFGNIKGKFDNLVEEAKMDMTEGKPVSTPQADENAPRENSPGSEEA